MNCEQFKKHLYPHLDRELTDNLRREMEDHFAACPLCSLEYKNEEKFHQLVKNYLIAEKAPFELREKIVQQLHPSSYFSILQFLKIRPVAIGLVFLLVMISVFVQQDVVRRNLTRAIMSESTANHLEFLKGTYPLEFKTNDIQEALVWFSGKTDFAVQPPHVSLEKARLQGGRLIHLNQKKTAYFVFEKDGHKISAFYVDLHGKKQFSLPTMQRLFSSIPTVVIARERGFNTVFCFHPADKTACIIVSDLPVEILKEIMT